MTRAEAEASARRLASEHPDRATHRWIAREGLDGEWSVVKIRVPEGTRIDPLKATIAARSKPPDADDSRPNVWRDVGGPYAG